jgi:hypothetical protein
MARVVNVLLHVYRKGAPPFRTLSSLTDKEAVAAMRSLYVAGSVFWNRFADPRGYLQHRRRIERDLRDKFVVKGGRPADDHPIYMILGRPQWLDTGADIKTLETTELIEVPLSVVPPDQISFTYPDSMSSSEVAAELVPGYLGSELHGAVFTLEEITEIVEARGLPGEHGQTGSPDRPPPYIEAQVWNQHVLDEYMSSAGFE